MARAGKKPPKRRVVGGVDTHSQTHHAAVQLMDGARVADAEFPATGEGYARLLAWMRSYGRLHAVGVEGTGSYGAGLARHLRGQGVTVIEVSQPDRRQRRAKGKSDPLDAYAAADAVIAGRAAAIAKTGDGIVEAIRALHLTRAGAIKARTAAINELKALLVTAPASLREQLTGTGTGTPALIAACARLRPAGDPAAPEHATKTALRSLARRCQVLTSEVTALDSQLAPLATRACPALLAIGGVGTETAAQLLITCGDNPDRLRSQAAFAALCGVSPIPASSGKTNRHRLNRGGDRQANRALYMIVLGRLGWCARTRAYAARRTAEGHTTKEIIRCLKRYLARQIYKALTRKNTTIKDLEQPLDKP
jgi:transposase